jgi:anti-sigma-K factor RskA
MIDDEEIDGLAAEYVLGSLNPVERAKVAVGRKMDPTLDAAIKAWERRLNPLSDALPGVEPPRRVLRNVMRQIEAPRQQPIAPVKTSAWSRGARLGAAFAGGACAMAACVAAVLLWPSQAPPSMPARLVAELEKSNTANGMMPARVPLGFVVYFDLRASTMIVSPLAVPPGSRRDYQLWLVPHGSAPPISLGVIPLAEPTTLPWPATFPPNDLTHATLAVSLEPAGGAPKGVPTSPTMFAGKLVPTIR